MRLRWMSSWRFYKEFYVPNNAILSIASDIDIEKTKAQVAKYFGDIPKGTKPIYRPNVQEPPQEAASAGQCVR